MNTTLQIVIKIMWIEIEKIVVSALVKKIRASGMTIAPVLKEKQ